MSEIQTVTHKGEPRVDSRIIAYQLGIQHKNALELIQRYQKQMEELGVFPFQTEKPRKGSKGGRPQKHVLLNEDQAYLLLTLVSNTGKAVQLKLNLVKAFRLAREGQAIDTQYLPFYHVLHDEVKRLHGVAKEHGSTTAESTYHMNINRLINKTLGLSSGERPTLTPEQRAFVTSANVLVRKKLVEACNAGLSFKVVYQDIKQALAAYAAALLSSNPAIEHKGERTA